MLKKNNKSRSRKLKPFILFGFLLTLFFILIVTSVGRKNFTSPQKLALEIFGFAQKAVTELSGIGKSFWSDYVALWEVRKQNILLQQELKNLKALNNEYREAAVINLRLSRQLELKETLPSPSLTTRVIGRDPSLWYRNLIIDQGSSSGVQKGMPVVTVDGVVGQVMQSSPHYAKVLLAIDPNSAIDTLIQESRVPGVLKGDDGNYRLEYVRNNYQINKGDTVITSGMDGVFPKGVLVGQVTLVENSRRGMFQKVEIVPAVDFSQLEFLVVILKKNPLAE